MGTDIRVLVVEDHGHLRNQLQLLLSVYEGIKVVGSAADGQEAVDLCRALHPDVILMDAQLPVMDGFTATKTIRNQYPDTEVVILTNGLLGDGNDAVQAGANAYLLKPAASEEIVQTIRNAYGSHRKTDTQQP